MQFAGQDDRAKKGQFSRLQDAHATSARLNRAADCVSLILPFFNTGDMHFPEPAQAIASLSPQTGGFADEVAVTRGHVFQAHAAGVNR
jgi:hypothetical protein